MGSLWAHLRLVVEREPWAVQGKQSGRLARSLDCRIWGTGGFAPRLPSDLPSFSRSQGPPCPKALQARLGLLLQSRWDMWVLGISEQI